MLAVRGIPRARPPIAAAPLALLLLLLLSAVGASAAQELPPSAAAARGRVFMMRHANAPGAGDPPGFKLGDCSTQRNLDAKGRAQARAVGASLRAALSKARLNATVYSSEWCRAQETARLLDLGRPRQLPALNSFFSDRSKAGPQIARLREFLAGLPKDGPPVILVTHQVVINEFTSAFPDSAGGSVFQLNGSGSPRWLGSVGAPAGA